MAMIIFRYLLKKIAVTLFITSCVLMPANKARAEFQIPPVPRNYVSDYAGVLKGQQLNELNTILQNYDSQNGNQIFVGIFNSLEGENLENLSIRIAEKWAPGRKEKDNGVLLLVFLKERKVRIEVGYGLESLLTDALANAIIINEIAPHFREGNYYDGIKAALMRIIDVISGNFSSQQVQQYLNKNKEISSDFVFLLFLFMFIFFQFFLIHLRRRSGSYYSGGYYSGGYYGGGSYYGGGGFLGGRGGSFGGGGASGGW